MTPSEMAHHIINNVLPDAAGNTRAERMQSAKSIASILALAVIRHDMEYIDAPPKHMRYWNNVFDELKKI
jgi:ABC-type uncharacterized transport system ATPase subunit